MNVEVLSIVMLLAPLTGGVIAGLFGQAIGRRGAHALTIAGVSLSFCIALYFAKHFLIEGASSYQAVLYTWGASAPFRFNVAILLDSLTALMTVVVTFVSLLVHIYSIGYMHDDPGYQRFFSYMSLFTFAMLTLVCANNFMLLFFGWEGVGLVSYLLIGFWFKKETAAVGSLKAFLVNRVGDFGFILGIAAVLKYVGSLDYATVFNKASSLATQSISLWPEASVSVVTVICLLLFVGAMGKSAQLPLHIWLPESMEGPTPISALIHAATMVTAGIYMVARLSPLFELSQPALSVVLVTGATGALFLGLVGVVQHDIKRVIAYSTMSQLGYMMAANGASAFSAGIFHLATHAAFKALLFLGAGSVIIAMHHEQDMRKMGNLKKYMPVTYWTFLIGALALTALPPFAGYYSKDAIISAVGLSSIPGAHYAYVCLLLGAFVTALYTFRAFFLTFHGKERIPADIKKHVKESPWVVTVPLIILALASLLLGIGLAGPMLYNKIPWLHSAVYVLPQHDVLGELAREYKGPIMTFWEALLSPAFWLAVTGIGVAWFCYLRSPEWPERLIKRVQWLYKILLDKYGFDALVDRVLVRGTQATSQLLYRKADEALIDRQVVNGTGRIVLLMGRALRRLQSGYLYHYAFAMIIGLLILLGWLI